MGSRTMVLDNSTTTALQSASTQQSTGMEIYGGTLTMKACSCTRKIGLTCKIMPSVKPWDKFSLMKWMATATHMIWMMRL